MIPSSTVIRGRWGTSLNPAVAPTHPRATLFFTCQPAAHRLARGLRPARGASAQGQAGEPWVLGHEGMAISADKKFAYFFPGDVPGGKLVRYHIVDK